MATSSKPKPNQYSRIDIQMESPNNKSKSNPLLKLAKSLSPKPSHSKSTNTKHHKALSPINNGLLDIKASNSLSKHISRHSDSDSNDTKRDEEDLTPSLPKKNHQFIYHFANNDGTLKQELIESLLERLKIALTFLLHDESPLWNNEMDEDDNDIKNISSIYHKGTLSNNLNKKPRSLDSNPSVISSHSSTNKAIGFQSRCTEYTQNDTLFGEYKRSKQILNALFHVRYISEYKSLYLLWNQWLYYAKLKEDGHRIHIGHLKLRDEIQENHQILELDCVDFVEAKNITKKTASSMVSAMNKIRGKTYESDEYLAKSATISTLRSKLGSKNRSLSSQKAAMTSRRLTTDEDCSEHQLKTVKTRHEMKKWIQRFKSTEGVQRKCCCYNCLGFKWIKVCFDQCCCECKGIRDKMEKEDKNLRIPMDLWSWQNVVACIEDAVYVDDDGEQHELKHFASVFWQYQIEGNELVVMDVLQIELLVECWFLNNIQEQFFDEVKLKSKQEDDDGWHLSLESEYLMRYIDKLRIHSHVVSRYHLSMDIVQLIVDETEDDETINNNVYQDAINIKYCIDLLRSNIFDGPKKYWKLDAHYFNKIDNYLSVLICSQTIREMYLKCYTDFLYQEKKRNYNEIMEEQTQRKSLRSQQSQPIPTGSTRFRNNPSNKGNINSFNSIQAQLTRNVRSFSQQQSSMDLLVNTRKYEEDVLDKCTDKCCDNTLCEYVNGSTELIECIHNLDRIYLKTMCLIIVSMLLGAIFVIQYYFRHGVEQADDAMFLSLEAIGDRASRSMSYEFWIPQMINSLTIGGLTTGDLVPNASLYAPNYKYDQFFASFTAVSHTDAVFSVFMYNNDLNTMIGAYKVPKLDDDLGNGSVVIIDYNGTCRVDRLYDESHRMRIMHEAHRAANHEMQNYLNCDWNPKIRPWYTKAQDIGVGHSKWTEPYVFGELYRGMSYVAPIIWKGMNLTFVVDVTTYTLSIAISNEIQNLPKGTLWMVVTPGFNAVASSINETLIDAPNCTECLTDNDMIHTGIHWMKSENISGEQHFTAYTITQEYDISLYSFKMNQINLHPKPPYTDFNDYIVKPLSLNNASDYQYGYIAIVEDEQYLADVRNAWYASSIITVLSVGGVLILIICNIRYNNIEQRELGREGRSGIIKATYSKRLSLASSKISSFHKSRSSLSTSQRQQIPFDQSLRTFDQSSNRGKDIAITIGDRVKTKDNKYGIVKFVGELDNNGQNQNVCVLLDLENNKGTILVQLVHIIMNFGHNSEHSPVPESNREINSHRNPINRSFIDNKILNTALSPIIKAGESDDDYDDDDDEEEEMIHEAGHLITHSSTFTRPHRLSVIEDEDKTEDPMDNEYVDCCCCSFCCIKQKQFELLDEQAKQCCYLPQKTLLYTTYLCLCATLIILILIWETLTTDATMTLFEDVMAKHEWSTVQDLSYQLFQTSEMIADIVTDRFYRNDMDLSNSNAMDRFFVNVMQSFADETPNYMQYFIYIATPNGNLRGAMWSTSQNISTLGAGIRDHSTNYSYNEYLINDSDGYHTKNVMTDVPNDLYDPRCRIWYKNTLYYVFEGTMDQAFPNDTYTIWKEDVHSPTNHVSNCKDNQEIYESMWNITNISQSDEWKANIYKYNGDLHTMAWTRYLFASMKIPQIGLTGSKPIIDPETGELLAVVAIDYTLNSFSEYIAQTVENPFDVGQSQISYDNWRSWIFESNGDPQMIASSHGNVLRDAKETEGCYGFLVSVESELVPYNADEHPEALIRVYSKEVIDVYGIDMLDINGSNSQRITVPHGLPALEGGRIQFNPGGNASIDWIILKTTDVSDSFVDDFHITAIGIMLLMACVWVLLKELDYTDKMELSDLLKRNSNKQKRKYIEKKEDLDRTDYIAIMDKMQPIVDGAANSKWYHLMTTLESTMNNNNIGYSLIITTEQAKLFLANLANAHIASENENNTVFRECAWNACNYTTFRKRFQMYFWEFIESNVYDIPIQILLLAHLVATFWEPPTPKQLSEHGLSSNVQIVLGSFQIIQWFDCLLIGAKRYFEFSIKEPYLTSLYELNYGFNHKYTRKVSQSASINNAAFRALYLTFSGPQHRRYIAHILMVSIDLINYVLQITFRIAPFSYYIPILPLFIIVRNNHVLLFGADFVRALIYAKDVLFSYFCFILIFAILSMSLFSDRVNDTKFADSFQTINSAFITGFVFISTSENYAITYDIFDSEYYSDSHWIVLGNVVLVTVFFAMMGMFCWIPMIIDKFEQAFEESNMKHDEKHKLRKTNAIIAAFVMLDFNGDLDIDHNEFECLITCSVLIEKNKLFNAFDSNSDDALDIYEFVAYLLKQSFRTKVMSKLSGHCKLTAYCECNILRHREYTLYIFVFLVIPVIGLSVIKGLSHRFNEGSINDLIITFFVLNMIEIHFRCFCFGINRFWDLLKYPNPRYVIAAICNSQFESSESETIRLTESERNWVSSHLRSVRPLSILEKSTQTLINRCELITFWFCLISYIVMQILFGIHELINKYYQDNETYGNNNINVIIINDRYCLYFLQLSVMMRIFTVIPSNQRLLYMIFDVFPDFVALFAFLGLYIYCWARIGCTLFGDNRTDIVLPQIYDAADDMVANFDSLSYAFLALIQLMIGEGWHEVMYFNIIATNQFHSLYFIIYITVCSIIIANVFVGLFLADIDQLTQQQSHHEIINHSTKKSKSFHVYAKKKLNKLFYQINQNTHQNELMTLQIQHINDILYQQQQLQYQRQHRRQQTQSLSPI